MPITKGSSVLVAEAMAQVKTYTVPEVLARLHDPMVQIVDIRDVRELKDGTVTGITAPRAAETASRNRRLPWFWRG